MARSTSQATLYSMRLRGQSHSKTHWTLLTLRAQITIAVYGVADLGNLTTTGANISISAGGNIDIGTINAGTGTVLITSGSGAVFNSNNGSTTLSVTAGLLALRQFGPERDQFGPERSSAASAAQAASVQDQLNAAEAAATAEAAAAVVAADQTTAAAFQSAMNSMQAAVTIDTQTYQDGRAGRQYRTTTRSTPTECDNRRDRRCGRLWKQSRTLPLLLGLVLDEAEGAADETGALDIDIPLLDTISFESVAGFKLASGYASYVSALAFEAEDAVNFEMIISTNKLSNDEGTLAADQSAKDQAYAQLQADTDSETAFAAAYNVAEQAYTTALATSNLDEMASQAAQQAAAVAEANAAAAAQAAAAAPGGFHRPPTRRRHQP